MYEYDDDTLDWGDSDLEDAYLSCRELDFGKQDFDSAKQIYEAKLKSNRYYPLTQMKQSEQTTTSNSFIVKVDTSNNKIKTLKSTKNTRIRRKLTNWKCNSGPGKSSWRRQHYPFNNTVERVNTVRSVLDTTKLKTEAKEELYEGIATI